ncbi:type II toxin-antitoxin system RelE/ParE family toxin [Streptomyces sp. NPDC052207]|uniref:type II toxin-antitoxin system RelE/ParE family toxin n=1 Tax=Streptomyces sp. NPDC052207 TaxID=3155418 RepID=UPI0034360238
MKQWIDLLSDDEYLVVEHVVERLLEAPTTLGHPYSSHLGDGVRELRFILGHDGNKIRITYWLTSDRRIVLLTVFRKTRQREDAQVERALLAKKICEEQHEPAPTHETFTRDIRMEEEY